ncbi:MAG: hypothetical protein ACRENE_30930, partial [Polyangiaceae bacterium]
PVGDAPSSCDPCLLASGLNHPFLMTADSQNVYWTEFGDDLGVGNGAVKGCPTSGCGGSGPTLYAQGLVNPRGIAVDATNVYYGTASYGAVNGGIWSCAIGGCGGSPMLLSAADVPYGVTVDATAVYWVDNDDGTVHKVAKTGGPATTLYDGGSVDDAGDTLSELGQCAVGANHLVFGDYSEDIYSIPTGGGPPLYLGNGFNNQFYGSYFGITADSTSVYSGGNGLLLRATPQVLDSGTTLVGNVVEPIGLQWDPASGLLYWANYGSGYGNDGTVGRVATDGGGLHTLRASLETPEAIAVSGQYALWISNGTLSDGGSGTNPSSGALWRTAK